MSLSTSAWFELAGGPWFNKGYLHGGWPESSSEASSKGKGVVVRASWLFLNENLIWSMKPLKR
jgi:hypothetical protein